MNAECPPEGATIAAPFNSGIRPPEGPGNVRVVNACSERRETRDASDDGGALPPPLAGEGGGEGISATGQSPRGETLTRVASRRDLSRMRERCTEFEAFFT